MTDFESLIFQCPEDSFQAKYIVLKTSHELAEHDSTPTATAIRTFGIGQLSAFKSSAWPIKSAGR
jgi:hypothetical protein